MTSNNIETTLNELLEMMKAYTERHSTSGIKMVTLQYFNGTEWVDAGVAHNYNIAWITLGSDNYNYRVIDKDGNVLIENSQFQIINL